MAYKFLITLNAGAFIVMLTFISGISEKSRFEIELSNLKLAMFGFLLAIIMTFVSMTVAYLSAQLHLLGKTLPFGRSAAGHILWLVSPVMLAFFAFVLGVIAAIQGIT